MNNFPSGYQTSDASGIAFNIFSFSIRYYGIFFALGFFVAIVIGILKLRFFYKVFYEPFFFFVFFGVFSCLLGARIWSYVIGDATDWSNFFNLRTGGLAVEGGVIFTVITAFIWFIIFTKKAKYCVRVKDEFGVVWIRKVSLWVYADAIIPLILIGQAVGRWGNFFNHEVYGAIVGTMAGEKQAYIFGSSQPTTVIYYDPGTAYAWLKSLMPGVYRGMFIYTSDGILAFRVPLFLIESFFNVLAFSIIYGFIDQIKGYHCGTNAGLYFVYYGCLRTYLETLRASPYYYHLSIVTSICFIIAGVGLVCFTQFLAPRFRRCRFWYLVFIYATYWLKRVGYSLIKTKELAKNKAGKTQKISWGERKKLFLTKKTGLGYQTRPKFKRENHELFHYYDVAKMGPLYCFIVKIFRKLLRTSSKNKTA